LVLEEDLKEIKEVLESCWPDVDKFFDSYNYFEKHYKNKVFYVWFDAPIGYVSFLKEFEENFNFYDITSFKDKNLSIRVIDKLSEVEIDSIISLGFKNSFENFEDEEELKYRCEYVCKIEKDGEVLAYAGGIPLGFAFRLLLKIYPVANGGKTCSSFLPLKIVVKVAFLSSNGDLS
jgi:hypothetical protein